jgi:hypothetical protein
MNVHKADVYNPPPTNRVPSRGKPSLLDETVNQNMEMRLPVLVKFQNCDVLRGGTELPAKIRSQLIEGVSEVDHGIAFDLFRVEGEGHEPLQL